MQVTTDSELKQIIINTVLDTDLTPEVLEFFDWLIAALGLQRA